MTYRRFRRLSLQSIYVLHLVSLTRRIESTILSKALSSKPLSVNRPDTDPALSENLLNRTNRLDKPLQLCLRVFP